MKSQGMLKSQLSHIPHSLQSVTLAEPISEGCVCVCVCVCGGGGGGKFYPRVLFLSLRGWAKENTGNKVMAVLTGILLCGSY